MFPAKKLELGAALSLALSFALPGVTAQETVRQDFGPKISPDGTQVVFYSYLGENKPDIYIVNVDGTNVRQLTDTPDTWEILPRWSPDGSRIYVTAGPAMGKTAIYSMKTDGSDWRQESFPPADSGDGDATLAQGPDGAMLFFSRGIPGGGQQLLLRKSEGAELEVVMTMNIENAYAARLGFHPDGKRVLFTSSFGVKENPRPYELYSLDIASGRASQITYTPQTWERQAAWTRDGEGILFANDEAGSFDLYRIPAEGGEKVRITRMDRSHELFSDLRGDLLVFDAGYYPDNVHSCIYAADANGENVRLLTGSCDYHLPKD